MDVDERGIPVLQEGEHAAPEAPPKPCDLCTGTAADGTPSWEWCQSMKTCGATIDWEAIYEQH
jgi:hypothetical protein